MNFKLMFKYHAAKFNFHFQLELQMFDCNYKNQEKKSQGKRLGLH